MIRDSSAAAPIHVDPSLGPVLRDVHAIAGTVILYGVLLHVAGVIKRVVFNRDRTFSRMMTPDRQPAEIARTQRVHRQFMRWKGKRFTWRSS